MPTLLWTPDRPTPLHTHTTASATKINLFPKCQRLQLWVKFSPQDTGVNSYGVFSHHSSESLVYNLKLWGGMGGLERGPQAGPGLNHLPFCDISDVTACSS